MSPSTSTRASVPRDPRARHIWIAAALRLAGSSFAAIARDLEVTPQAVQQATRMSNRRAQEAIAARIGMPVQDLFAKWYHADGTRIGDPICCDDNTDGSGRDNAKSGGEART